MRAHTSRRYRARIAFAIFCALPAVVVPCSGFAQGDSQRLRRDTLGAPVVFGTDTLFRLFASLGPFTAESRAAAASERLEGIGPSLSRGDSIVVTDREAYSELALRDRVLMTVLDDDARRAGVGRAVLATRFAAEITRAAIAEGERLSPRALATAAAFAALATLALALVLWAFAFAFPKLYVRIDRLRQVRLPAVRIQEFELLSAGRLTAILVGVARVARVILTLLLFYIYVPLVLSFFPWTAPFSQRIVGYAVKPFAAAGTALLGYLPNVFYLAAGIIIVRYVFALLHLLFGAIGTGAITIRGFYADWADPTYKIVRVLVLAFAAMALYPYLPGASSDAFKGVSLFIGVLFSLGSSAAIGNMVAGVVLTYTRAFQIGDRVKIADTTGDVIERTLLVTRLRTIKNVAVTIPNGAVLGSHIVNYTTLAGERGLILHTSVTIGYDAPWRQVHALLIDAARRTEFILAEPPAFVLQTSLDDFYVSYEINAYTDRPHVMAATYSQLHQNIQETFNESGVEIMSPHYGALRDGNPTTVPSSYLGVDYRAPAFRIERIEGVAAGGGETAAAPSMAERSAVSPHKG